MTRTKNIGAKVARVALMLSMMALTVGVGACGGSAQTPEQKHSGFYNMTTLAKNLEGGAEESPGPGHVTSETCVRTLKATATCEMIFESPTDKKVETAGITINPEGTNFVISHREASNTPKAESSESSSSTGGTWDEEEKLIFTRSASRAGESEAEIQCELPKAESHFSTREAWNNSSAEEDVTIMKACEGL
jgi:hypothetical protein